MEQLLLDLPHYTIVRNRTERFGLINKYLSTLKNINSKKIEDTIIMDHQEILFNNNKVYITSAIIDIDMKSYAFVVYVLCDADKNNINEFFDYLRQIRSNLQKKIFYYDFICGCYCETDETFEYTNNLVGYDHYLDQLARDITAIKTKRELLIKLGALSGRNYLLSGPPGTGKTTFVKAIAAKFGIPIFIVKMTNDTSISQSILSPVTAHLNDGTIFNVGDSLSIILVEDFELYVKKNTISMSNLLNSLDGFTKSYGMIRFFSLNNLDEIITNEALASRMSHIMYFTVPSNDIIQEYLYNLFPDNKNIPILLEKINGKKITIRNINNYISRYAFYDDPISECMPDFDSWLVELEKIESKRSALENNGDIQIFDNKYDNMYKQHMNSSKNHMYFSHQSPIRQTSNLPMKPMTADVDDLMYLASCVQSI